MSYRFILSNGCHHHRQHTASLYNAFAAGSSADGRFTVNALPRLAGFLLCLHAEPCKSPFLGIQQTLSVTAAVILATILAALRFCCWGFCKRLLIVMGSSSMFCLYWEGFFWHPVNFLFHCCLSCGHNHRQHAASSAV